MEQNNGAPFFPSQLPRSKHSLGELAHPAHQLPGLYSPLFIDSLVQFAEEHIGLTPFPSPRGGSTFFITRMENRCRPHRPLQLLLLPLPLSL